MAMRIIAAVTLGLAIAMAACGGGATAAGPVAQAQADFEAGNYDGAQKACDRIMADSAGFTALDVAQLCTLAELYIWLDSARMDTGVAVVEPNEASAVRCLGRARELDADSVDAFIGSRPRDRASRLAVINIVSTYLAIPRDSLVVEDEQIYDSI